MTLVERHFKNTAKLVKALNTDDVANWLLNEGYYPEQYILPPSFAVSGFGLKKRPYVKDLRDPTRRALVTISYPKSLLTSRVFGIQHPYNYHDLVYYILEDWDQITEHLFHADLKIYSYSFPIPVNAKETGKLSALRSGRMIYEWIEMAEKDMVAEAHKYNFIIRTDITNFYNSVYTHSIGWAIHGREVAFKDKQLRLTGNKLDRLVQYANDGKTNGIPVGSALSDLLAEIILTSIDRKVSKKLRGIDFIGSRFKDDYRILCNSHEDAKAILKVLSDELINFNLLINEQKTKVLSLPDGLYRHHDREYHIYSLKYKRTIPFKIFELTLLKALDIHKQYPGTSILEKFFSELYNDDMELKVEFSKEKNTRRKQIMKALSLLMLLKRESEKVLCHVLAICEAIYEKYASKALKGQLRELIESEIRKASQKRSTFELVWLVFFSRYIGLGITNFATLIDKTDLESEFLNSIVSSKQMFFPDSRINLFIKPRDCKDVTLVRRLAVFHNAKE
ncbi:MAG: reverse transcriptase domain-containing protein [Cyclobacteriaceae bacterium]